MAERQSQAQNNLIEKGIVFVDFPLGAEKQIEVSDVLIPSFKTIEPVFPTKENPVTFGKAWPERGKNDLRTDSRNATEVYEFLSNGTAHSYRIDTKGNVRTANHQSLRNFPRLFRRFHLPFNNRLSEDRIGNRSVTD